MGRQKNAFDEVLGKAMYVTCGWLVGWLVGTLLICVEENQRIIYHVEYTIRTLFNQSYHFSCNRVQVWERTLLDWHCHKEWGLR